MKLFISHAVADQNLTHEFARFLRTGCDLSAADIFVSSKPGMSIPNGRSWVDDILTKLDKADLVICILTPSFFKSHTCIAESGVAQFRTKAQKKVDAFYSLVVPPARFADLDGVLYGVQSGRMDEEAQLDLLAERIETIAKKRIAHSLWSAEKCLYLPKIKADVNARLKTFTMENLVLVNQILDASDAPGIHFKRKLRFHLRNDTDRQIVLSAVSWAEARGGLKAHPNRWFVLQERAALAWRKTEAQMLSVPPRGEVLASVALDNAVTKAAYDRMVATGGMGKLSIAVDIEGHRIIYEKSR